MRDVDPWNVAAVKLYSNPMKKARRKEEDPNRRPEKMAGPNAYSLGPKGMIEATSAAASFNLYTANRARADNQAHLFAPGADGRIAGIYRDEIAHFLACIGSGHPP